MNSVLQYLLYVVILVALAIPLGIYMSKVMAWAESSSPLPPSS
ncbi:MAG: hypothetical protein ACI3VN_11730 [Candidatus Onthomonas sp.]